MGDDRRHGRRHGRRHVWIAGLLGGLIAMAVWGKLRFVSNVPRMAYADPEQHDGTENDHAGAEGRGGLDRSNGPTP